MDKASQLQWGMWAERGISGMYKKGIRAGSHVSSINTNSDLGKGSWVAWWLLRIWAQGRAQSGAAVPSGLIKDMGGEAKVLQCPFRNACPGDMHFREVLVAHFKNIAVRKAPR